MVGRTLEGHGHDLKERILGIEDSDRPPDYDTNTDPIVRVTAAEIRKRIDQYYHDPKHGQEIRLFLDVRFLCPPVFLARLPERPCSGPFPATERLLCYG